MSHHECKYVEGTFIRDNYYYFYFFNEPSVYVYGKIASEFWFEEFYSSKYYQSITFVRTIQFKLGPAKLTRVWNFTRKLRTPSLLSPDIAGGLKINKEPGTIFIPTNLSRKHRNIINSCFAFYVHYRSKCARVEFSIFPILHVNPAWFFDDQSVWVLRNSFFLRRFFDVNIRRPPSLHVQ